MAKAHWTNQDFVRTRTYETNRYGYCRKCGGDMQSLYGGPLRHYNSHDEAKRAGVNWHALAGK